jgi:hypothetical protein
MESKLTNEQKTEEKPVEAVKPEIKEIVLDPKVYNQKEVDEMIRQIIKENKLEKLVKAPDAKESLVLKKKISTSEAGNMNNISNFKDGYDMAFGWGPSYNPYTAGLKLPAMLTQYNGSFASQQNVYTQAAIYRPFEGAAREGFDKLSSLVVRAFGILESCGAPVSTVNNARTLKRKICGERATPKIINPGPDDPKQISASQMGRTNRLDNLYGFVQILINCTQYNPNETELNDAGMMLLYTNLLALNNAVGVASAPYTAAIKLRNELLYTDVTGLCDTFTHGVKKYAKGLWGFTNANYKAMSKIKMKKRKVITPKAKKKV